MLHNSFLISTLSQVFCFFSSLFWELVLYCMRWSAPAPPVYAPSRARTLRRHAHPDDDDDDDEDQDDYGNGLMAMMIVMMRNF